MPSGSKWDGTGRPTLPPFASLNGHYPPQFAAEVEKLAVRVMRDRLLMPFLLRVAVHRRKDASAPLSKRSDILHCMKQAVEHCDLFSLWPPSVRDAVVSKSQYVFYRSREIVLHQGEPANYGVVVLVSGACDVLLSSHDSGAKGLTGKVTLVERVETHHVFGSLSIFNEERRSAFVVCATDCVIAVIPRSAIFDCLASATSTVPFEVVRSLVASSMEERCRRLAILSPMTRSRLRVSPLFAKMSTSLVDSALQYVVPKVLPRGSIILQREAIISEICFVAGGAVCVSSERGPQVFLQAGASFGERETLLQDHAKATYTAVTMVDLFTLPFASIQQLRKEDVEFAFAIDSMSWCTAPQSAPPVAPSPPKMRAFSTSSIVRSVPLLRDLLVNDTQVNELAALFTSRRIPATDMIVHASDTCDRLLCVTRGAARTVGTPTPYHLCIGDTIGFTCLLCHRWQHSVKAVEEVRVVELLRTKLYEYLQHHGLYSKMLELTIQLMQPYFPTSNRSPFLASIAFQIPRPSSFPLCKTPNMYPVVLNERRELVFTAWTPALEEQCMRAECLTQQRFELLQKALEEMDLLNVEELASSSTAAESQASSASPVMDNTGNAPLDPPPDVCPPASMTAGPAVSPSSEPPIPSMSGVELQGRGRVRAGAAVRSRIVEPAKRHAKAPQKPLPHGAAPHLRTQNASGKAISMVDSPRDSLISALRMRCPDMLWKTNSVAANPYLRKCLDTRSPRPAGTPVARLRPSSARVARCVPFTETLAKVTSRPMEPVRSQWDDELSGCAPQDIPSLPSGTLL